MANEGKCSNIYINPKFNDSVKSVIHINPKVHVNMAIHVNPKMVNTLSTCGLRQMQKFQLPSSIQSSSNILSTNIQKSIYVNPKLMEKLTNKVPDVVCKSRTLPTSQPQISRSNSQLKSKTIHVNKNVLLPKQSPSKLVSLSKRKLVRVRPIVKTILTNNNSANGNSNDRIVKSSKPVAPNKSKKFNKVDRRVTVVNKSKRTQSSSTNTRYKIDRTAVQKKKISKVRASPRKVAGRANTNLIKIDGVLYKSSKTQIVKSNSSNNRSTDQQKRRSSSIALLMNRKIAKIKSTMAKTISSRNSTGNVAQKSKYKYILSNRVKQKSIQILRHKMTKNNQPCLLFQRFGYCAKFTAGTCPKVHDKKQVALCKNFLQGSCLLDNCPLSHEVGPEKMPTCKYFLEGCCIRDACPYLHVKVSANTPICIPFLQGYCAKGDKCKERHTNICPELEKTGKCAKGKNCPYPHKSIMLAKQHQQHRLTKNSKKTFNKQTLRSKTKVPMESINLSERDESKKRYYDDDNNCLDVTFAKKKSKILDKIHIMKHTHTSNTIMTNSQLLLPDLTVDNDNNTHQQSEDDSQPCHQNVQYKRRPIGPLPAYIPI